MNKYRVLIVLLATAVIGVGLAQPAPLPEDEQFDQLVEVRTEFDGVPLSSMVATLARSVGLTPIVEQVPDNPVIYDIGDPKPFRQVWNIVLTLNGLDYRLLENDVIVVGPTAAIAGLGQGQVAEAAADGEPREQRFYRVNNNPNDLATIISRAVPGVAIEALESVSTLSVTATAEQHEQVQRTLDQFDTTAEVVPIELRTYRLNHADAEDLAAVLEATSGSIISEVSGAEGGEPAAEGRNFRVTAEPRTNSLIVAATGPVQARVAELIPQLDVPQQQVNVQVRIQEINRSSAMNLGINLNAGVGMFTANILETGLRFVFDSATALTSLNLNAVLDALETQGLSKRVDDTTITVLDNVTGTVQSGGTIYITIPGANENIQRTIPYGVQVDVTPRIAADGSVTLDVVARVEDVLSTTNDPSFLELSTRAVTSTVTLEPGQTVLLSGLMQNQFVETKNRVPILGAIPVIGGLFGTTVTEQNDTELLVIVSANVLE
ncbi:MAG TPA: secretin N-terminal domain-containing protein [Trueperaceae bacterium]